MKKILLFATAFTFTLNAMAQPAATKPDDVIKMNADTHDFGKIKQNVPAIYNFEIKNISDKPVVVASATASCGCTVPEKPEQPIEPGKTGVLKVQFNAPAVGPINKDVTVMLAGVEGPKVLHLTGEVLTPEAYEEYVKNKPKSAPAEIKKDETKAPAKPAVKPADKMKSKKTAKKALKTTTAISKG
jgi:hypothetical protein